MNKADAERYANIAAANPHTLTSADIAWLVGLAGDLDKILADVTAEKLDAAFLVEVHPRKVRKFFASRAEAERYAAEQADETFRKGHGRPVTLSVLRHGDEPKREASYPLDVCAACNGNGYTTTWHGHRDWTDHDCSECGTTGRVKR